jgi:hypothetical protein
LGVWATLPIPGTRCLAGRAGDHMSMATHHRGYLPIHQARNQVALLVGLLGDLEGTE